MPIVNIFVPMNGIDPSVVTPDALLDRTSAGHMETEDPDTTDRLDCLALAVREQWRVVGNVQDGGLEHVELVKWFAELGDASKALTTVGGPSDRRFYIRTTDDPDTMHVMTNVADGPADPLHDPGSPAGTVRSH